VVFKVTAFLKSNISDVHKHNDVHKQSRNSRFIDTSAIRQYFLISRHVNLTTNAQCCQK